MTSGSSSPSFYEYVLCDVHIRIRLEPAVRASMDAGLRPGNYVPHELHIGDVFLGPTSTSSAQAATAVLRSRPMKASH
ncbi:MAG: hypothetical protein QF415_06760 [Candidatus Undinarchaeales archaeon]|nr:hypothetical protein [Candidatus Undinarchaeales archaeon]MDP7492655.1 hypothetical protein [Candidatus Undinarchaeales archaeon]